MKNLVVTGGAGFIGHHVVAQAVKRGWHVIVLDNLSTGKLANLELPSGRLLPNVEFYECDIVYDALPSIEDVASVDAIIHLAAPVSVEESLSNPEKYFNGIVKGSKRVFDWAKALGAQACVAASTAAVYGDREEWPFHEGQVLSPMSPYAEAKAEMEGLMEVLDMPATALRFFNVFGEGQPDDVGYVSAVPIFMKQWNAYKPITVTGTGEQTRDFVYVGDVARACLDAVERTRAGFEVINLASGEETAVIDIAEAFGGEIQHIAPREEPLRSWASIERAKLVLNWQPKTSVLDWIKSKKNA